jgi:alpha-L-fucosidase
MDRQKNLRFLCFFTAKITSTPQKVPMKKYLLLVLTAFLPFSPAADLPSADEARLRWFKEARFGLFIHWGVYAVPAGEYKGKEIPGIGEWIMKNGKIPVAEYQSFAKDFTAARYNPQAWAQLAKEAGIQYVVITAKHHDGFALYDSQVTPWSAAKSSGAQRDLLQPLATAVRAEGLKFGLYYSQAQDWHHAGGAGADWDEAQKGDYDRYLQTIALPQVDEILTRFHPDLIWWDTPKEMTPARVKPFADRISREKNLISNNRLGQGFPGDTMTPEQNIPPRGYPGKMFEVCMTMNDTWGFKKKDQHWKSAQDLIRKLSDISSKGGNFLLNVGPTAEGEIPQASIERLQAIGRWMKINGEAIYATSASPFSKRMSWGRATQKTAPNGKQTLYLHIWEWPSDGHLLLTGIDQLPLGGKLLADKTPVTFSKTPEGITIHLPGAARDPDVTVASLEFQKPIVLTQDGIPTVNKEGEIVLEALDADCHGHWDGNIQTFGKGHDAYLGDWKGNRWKVEYQIKTPAEKRWTLSAEISNTDPSSLTLKSGKTEIPVSIPAGNGEWKTITLGNVPLPAGETSFELIPVKETWKPIQLRHVRLIPSTN